jgi:hypothetical protein
VQHTFRAVVTFNQATAAQVDSMFDALCRTSGVLRPQRPSETLITFERALPPGVPVRSVQIACEEAVLRGGRQAGISAVLDYDVAIESEADAAVGTAVPA